MQGSKLLLVKFDVEVEVPEWGLFANLGASLVEFLMTLLLTDAGSDPLLGVAVRHCWM